MFFHYVASTLGVIKIGTGTGYECWSATGVWRVSVTLVVRKHWRHQRPSDFNLHCLAIRNKSAPKLLLLCSNGPTFWRRVCKSVNKEGGCISDSTGLHCSNERYLIEWKYQILGNPDFSLWIVSSGNLPPQMWTTCGCQGGAKKPARVFAFGRHEPLQRQPGPTCIIEWGNLPPHAFSVSRHLW